MADLELCKKIAEIEGATQVEVVRLGEIESLTAWFTLGDGFSYQKPVAYHNYRPHTDDALIWQLQIAHGIIIIPVRESYGTGKVIGYKAFYNELIDCVYDKSPHRAICLAIIEANKETT